MTNTQHVITVADMRAVQSLCKRRPVTPMSGPIMPAHLSALLTEDRVKYPWRWSGYTRSVQRAIKRLRGRRP